MKSKTKKSNTRTIGFTIPNDDEEYEEENIDDDE